LVIPAFVLFLVSYAFFACETSFQGFSSTPSSFPFRWHVSSIPRPHSKAHQFHLTSSGLSDSSLFRFFRSGAPWTVHSNRAFHPGKTWHRTPTPGAIHRHAVVERLQSPSHRKERRKYRGRARPRPLGCHHPRPFVGEGDRTRDLWQGSTGRSTKSGGTRGDNERDGVFSLSKETDARVHPSL